MPPKRTSTSKALEAQAVTMTSTSNPNKNTRPTGTPIAKMGNYIHYLSTFLLQWYGRSS
ncbi:hypothetical protein Tco_1559567, partial [Tanacetum coccineum]